MCAYYECARCGMNFDLNMMSTLMQLLSNNRQGKQQPFDLLKSFTQNPNRQNMNTYDSGAVNNEYGDAKNASAWQDEKKEQNASATSEFANINGIGTKVDINFDVNLGAVNQSNQNNNTRNVYANDNNNTNSAFDNIANNTSTSQFANIFSQFASNSQNNQNTNSAPNNSQSAQSNSQSAQANAQYTQSNTQSGQNDTAQNSFGASDESAGNRQSSQNFDASVLSQNPMFALLKMMQSPKKNANIMSMLPTLMSLLKPKTASQQNKANPDAGNSNTSNSNSNDNTANVDKNTSTDNIKKNTNADGCVEEKDNTDFENGKNENVDKNTSNVSKRKTQSDFFSPIAFAGYELVSSLCKLYLSTKRAV